MNANESADILRGVRSMLFTPGDRPDRFHGAGDAGADLLILDLEDAVAPASKEAARTNVIRYLGTAPVGPLRAVRINDPGTTVGGDDLEALRISDARPDVVVIPKTEDEDTVRRVLAALEGAGRAPAAVLPLIESAAGVLRASGVLSVPGVAGVMVGAADLAADLGMPEVDRELLAVPRAMVRLAAAAAGVPAFDTPWFDIRDADGLHGDVRAARAEGFTGKAAVHPAQIAPINTAWTPGADDVAAARRVLEAASAGVGEIDGHMVDEAMARRARTVLDRAPRTATTH